MENRNNLINEIKEELNINPKIIFESDNIFSRINGYINYFNQFMVMLMIQEYLYMIKIRTKKN